MNAFKNIPNPLIPSGGLPPNEIPTEVMNLMDEEQKKRQAEIDARNIPDNQVGPIVNGTLPGLPVNTPAPVVPQTPQVDQVGPVVNGTLPGLPENTTPPLVTSTPTEESMSSTEQSPSFGYNASTNGIDQQQAALSQMGKQDQELMRQEFIKSQAKAEAEALVAEEKMKREAEINNTYLQDVENVNKKVEELTNRKYEGFWANKSTGDKILAGLAVALSGNKNGNVAFDIYQKQANEDAMAFQEKKAAELQAIKDSKIDIDVKRKLANDSLQSILAYNIAQKNVVLNKMDEITSKIKGEKALSQANLLRGKLEADRDDAINKANMFNQQMAESKYKIDEENKIKMAATSNKPASKPLSVEAQKMATQVKTGSKAIKGMIDSLKEGDNTFSLVGDNNFTRNRTLAIEMFGRMQSGGAITDDEVDTFKKLLPSPLDNKKQQEAKLQQLSEHFNELSAAGRGENIYSDTEMSPQSKQSKFPLTITKNGQQATVNSEGELQEAQADGWR